jgi:hypothetical protein
MLSLKGRAMDLHTMMVEVQGCRKSGINTCTSNTGTLRAVEKIVRSLLDAPLPVTFSGAGMTFIRDHIESSSFLRMT